MSRDHADHDDRSLQTSQAEAAAEDYRWRGWVPVVNTIFEWISQLDPSVDSSTIAQLPPRDVEHMAGMLAREFTPVAPYPPPTTDSSIKLRRQVAETLARRAVRAARAHPGKLPDAIARDLLSASTDLVEPERPPAEAPRRDRPLLPLVGHETTALPGLLSARPKPRWGPCTSCFYHRKRLCQRFPPRGVKSARGFAKWPEIAPTDTRAGCGEWAPIAENPESAQ